MGLFLFIWPNYDPSDFGTETFPMLQSYISISEKVAFFPLYKGELGFWEVSWGGIKFHFTSSAAVIPEFELPTGFHLHLSGNNLKYQWLPVKVIAKNVPTEKGGMLFHHQFLYFSRYLLAT